MRTVTFKEYLLLIEAWFFLALARAILIVMPFKRIAPLLGKMNNIELSSQSREYTTILHHIKVGILRASRFSPWRTKCFEQAIAGKAMLRMRHISSLLYLGAYKDPVNQLKAHAWLIAGDIVVTGGPNIEQYTVVSWFGS
jgi:Transglutaminase-like superfamily